MQENGSIPTSTVTSEPSTVNTLKPFTVDRSQNSFLVLLLSTLLIISVLIAGFFAFQTQKLVAELRIMKNEVRIVPTATTSSASATADPTANWKTYVAEGYNFSFKYPADFKVETRVPGFYVISKKNENVAQAGVSLDARLLGPYSNLVDAKKVINDSLKISESTKVSGWEIFQGVGKDGMLKDVEFRQAIISYKTGVIKAETLANINYVNIFDQILSTFKFLD